HIVGDHVEVFLESGLVPQRRRLAGEALDYGHVAQFVLAADQGVHNRNRRLANRKTYQVTGLDQFGRFLGADYFVTVFLLPAHRISLLCLFCSRRSVARRRGSYLSVSEIFSSAGRISNISPTMPSSACL